MSEHTPGPWHVEQQTETDGVHVLICAAPGAEPGYPRESYMVAESSFENSPRGIANANLLAAAPDLLAALERIIETHDDAPRMLSTIINMERAAVTTARKGRAPLGPGAGE